MAKPTAKAKPAGARRPARTEAPAAASATARSGAPAPGIGYSLGRRATINDIARLASVSKKTVSRVINQSPFVKPETRAKIDAVIQEIGYHPDPQARGLAFRGSFLIGLIYTAISVVRSYAIRRWFNQYIVRAAARLSSLKDTS